MLRSIRLLALALALAALPGAALAFSYGPGVYTLSSHPDGSASPPSYGLRLDGLDGDPASVFTFDFDAADRGAAMQMTLGTSSLRIHGTAWGGRDGGSAYVDPELWEIDFSYDSVADLGARLGADDGTGTIRPVGGDAIGLVDQNGSHDYALYLGEGHRGYAGLSGWGWLDHDAYPEHVYDSDFLFTASAAPVPEPGAALLFGVGALAVSLRLRRG